LKVTINLYPTRVNLIYTTRVRFGHDLKLM